MMEFNELIADFATSHGVNGLSSEDGVAQLEIDGIAVTLVANAEELILSAEIGEPPAEEAVLFAHLLLEANLKDDAFFAKSPDGGPYVRVRRLDMTTLDLKAFDAALENLVNEAENWRRMLVDFRPAVEAAQSSAEEVSQTFGATGFMQV